MHQLRGFRKEGSYRGGPRRFCLRVRSRGYGRFGQQKERRMGDETSPVGGETHTQDSMPSFMWPSPQLLEHDGLVGNLVLTF